MDRPTRAPLRIGSFSTTRRWTAARPTWRVPRGFQNEAGGWREQRESNERGRPAAEPERPLHDERDANERRQLDEDVLQNHRGLDPEFVEIDFQPGEQEQRGNTDCGEQRHRGVVLE